MTAAIVSDPAGGRSFRAATLTSILLTVVLLGATSAGAQVNALQANLMVPSPTPYLAQWSTTPAVATLLVTNSAGVNVDVTVTAVFSRNDVEVGRAPGRITRLEGRTQPDTTIFNPIPWTTTFTAPSIADWSATQLVGDVGRSYARTGRLPEGQYTLCIRFDNPTPVEPTPRTVDATVACASFSIGNPQPPTLLLPTDESSVAGRAPVFSWTPVVAPGVPQVFYELRVVEVLPGQTPTRAVEANYPVFQTTVANLTALPYPPTALPLEVGKRYAWRVRARQSNPDADFAGPGGPLGENQGLSEVFTFTRAPLITAFPGVIRSPGRRPRTAVAHSPFYNHLVHGRLLYSFNLSAVPAPTRVQLPVTMMPVFQFMGQPQGRQGQGQGQAPLPQPHPVGQIQTQGGTGRTSTASPPEPLAGITVRLVVRYRTADDWALRGPVNVGGHTYDDVGRVVATATTDRDGRFTFAFHDDLPTGVIPGSAGQTVRVGHGDIIQTMDGPLARFYQVEVGDAHYLSPSDEIVLSETDAGDLGTLVSLVRSYRLRVHVIDRLTNNPPSAGDYTITVARQDRPPTVPEQEGEGPPGAFGPFTLLTRKAGSGTEPVTLYRLVRNIGPADRYRISFSVPVGSEANYRPASIDYANSWPWPLSGGPHAEATYNEDYNLNLIGDDTLYVTPLPPRYIGTLVDAQSDQPIQRASLILTDDRGHSRDLPRRLVPSDHGRFVWDIPAPSGTQEEWKITALALGYENVTMAAPTRPGYRRDQRVAMRPAGIVAGTVQDAGGNAVSADVWYGPLEQHAMAETKVRYQPSGGRQRGQPLLQAGRFVSGFEFRARAPSSDTLHIAPTEGQFCAVDRPQRLHAGRNSLGAITVPKKDRRVAVQVLAGRPGGLGGQFRLALPGVEPQPIAGAIVEAMDVYGPDGVTLMADTTDTEGRALLRLGPGDPQVRIRVRSPVDADYETGFARDSAAACGAPTAITVSLPPASRIAGTVYRGSGSDTPLEGARVTVDGRPALHATTDAQGRYVIRGVPRTTVTVRAGGVNTGSVAQERELAVSDARYEDFDFHIGGDETPELDWSDGLLGFPVTLTEPVVPVADGFAVTGQVYLPSNAAFANRAGVPDPAPVAFDSILVRPDGQNRPVPVADGVELGATELQLRLFRRYDVVQQDRNGLVLRPRGQGGALVAPVALAEHQFLEAAFEDGAGNPARPLLVGDEGSPTDGVATLTSDATAPSDRYRLAGSDGGELRFRIAGFPADAAPDATRLDADGLRTDATLHTSIAGIDDLALPAEGLRLTPGPDGGVEPLSVDHPLERRLQEWTLRTDGWSLVNGMAHLNGGALVVPVDTASDATVELPLTSIRVRPDELRSATFSNAPLSLGGVVDLNIRARDLSFGRDGTDGPWRISAATGASIPSLPGMRPTDEIPLGYFRILSDGDMTLTPEYGTVVRLFDAADFRVASVVPGAVGLTLGGALDAAIPNVQPITHSILYRRTPAGLQFDMVPLDIGPLDIGGARLRVEDAVLDSTGLHGDGYVEVPGQFRVATSFRRTPPSRGDVIEAVPADGSTIDVGEIAIHDLVGGARFLQGKWQTRFDGDLDLDGDVGGRLSFTVEDANVNVGTGGLDIKNIQTPFGELTITVNFPRQRIEGSMDIDGYITDGLYGTGRAEMVMSGAPANRYWHIYAGLGFVLESPRLEGSAAFIVGNTTLSGQLLADFNQYSVHGVPPSFYRIRGFFLEGQVSWPVPICPSGGVDIGVAQVGVWCNVNGDLRMGMNFLENNTYYMGGLVGLSVGASGKFGLGACVSLWGQVDARADMEGAYRSDGAWYVLGRANLDLRGGASYGVGIDDACLDYTTSFSIGVGAEAQLGRNWNTGEGRFVRVYFR